MNASAIHYHKPTDALSQPHTSHQQTHYVHVGASLKQANYGSYWTKTIKC